MAAPGFQYFTSNDDGAPQLYGASGRMIALLDWALVGKGGWAKAFSGTNLAAYRSATGNRFYLRVDDTQAGHARLRGYRAMTTVSAGTNIFPVTTLAPAAEWGAAKSLTVDTTPRRYWGIRTDRYVMLVVEPNNPVGAACVRSIFAFGDVLSACESDAFNTVLVASNYPYNTAITTMLTAGVSVQGFVGVEAGAHFAATPDGAANAPGCVMASAFTAPRQSYARSLVGDGAAGRMQLTPITVLSNNAASGGSGVGIVRATLPNLLLGAGSIPRTGLADLEEVAAGAAVYKLFGIEVFDPSMDGGELYATGFFAMELTDSGGVL